VKNQNEAIDMYEFVEKAISDFQSKKISLKELISLRYNFKLGNFEKTIGIAGLIGNKPNLIIAASDRFEEEYLNYIEAFYPDLDK
jgi:hypothetical protein